MESLNSGECTKKIDEVILEPIEENVDNLESVVDSDEKTPIKVATITFGYKNGELIRTLK